MNIEIMTMTKDEKSLLLYFEDCIVNSTSLIQPIRMNADDFSIAKRWHDQKFIAFMRCPSDFLKVDNPYHRSGGDYTHIVLFSDDAWEIAHKLREERGRRILSNIPKTRTNGELLIPVIEKATSYLAKSEVRE